MRKITFQVELIVADTETDPATEFAQDIYDSMSNDWVFGSDGSATVVVIKEETV